MRVRFLCWLNSEIQSPAEPVNGGLFFALKEALEGKVAKMKRCRKGFFSSVRWLQWECRLHRIACIFAAYSADRLRLGFYPLCIQAFQTRQTEICFLCWIFLCIQRKVFQLLFLVYLNLILSVQLTKYKRDWEILSMSEGILISRL